MWLSGFGPAEEGESRPVDSGILIKLQDGLQLQLPCKRNLALQMATVPQFCVAPSFPLWSNWVSLSSKFFLPFYFSPSYLLEVGALFQSSGFNLCYAELITTILQEQNLKYLKIIIVIIIFGLGFRVLKGLEYGNDQVSKMWASEQK